ncbi:MAG: NAD-dependent DNA ligase LigA, partial [Gemmiger sp.]
MDQKQKIDLLVHRLNQASDAYYGGKEEQMTNYEWDALFDELAALETETGYIREDSPTQNTGRAQDGTAAEGEKEPHEYPALSLAKTKEVTKLQAWAEDRAVWLSWKLDGLTLVATYDGGTLTKLLTRGNGIAGTNITYMKGAIRGLPLTVSEQGHLVVRGEATISYPDFERINDTLDDGDDKYANPRNLASGTLALDKTNWEKVRERCVVFNAFTLVHTDRRIPSWGERMAFLDALGFVTVEREKTNAEG